MRGLKHGNGEILSIAIAISDAYYNDSILWNTGFKLPKDMDDVFRQLEDWQANRIEEDMDPIHFSPKRVDMMSSLEHDVVEYYQRMESIRKTAETFLLDEDSVREILHKAEKYLWRKLRGYCSVEEYVNELSPIKLKPDKKSDVDLVELGLEVSERDLLLCDYLHGDCPYLVRDIQRSLDRKPTILELTTMTGYGAVEVAKAQDEVRKMDENARLRHRRRLKDYLE